MTRHLTMLLAAMLLVVAACGDSDDDTSGDGDDDTTETTAAAPETSETEAPEAAGDEPLAGDDPTGDQDGTPGEGAGDGDIPEGMADAFASEECMELGLALQEASSMGMAGEGSMEDAARALQELADSGPDEISEEMALLGDAFLGLAQTLEDAGVDLQDPTSLQDPEIQAQVTEAAEQFDTEELNAAGQRVEEYLTNECGG